MAEPLVIVGAGGFGRETADVVEAINAAAAEPVWALLGMIDDSPSDANLGLLADRQIPYLGTRQELVPEPGCFYVIGIGSPRVRMGLAGEMDTAGFVAATLIHPLASLGSQVRVGGGSVICAGARLTTNIDLGRHVHVNPNCTIGHDTKLGDFVSLNPASSISGDCAIEEGCLIGVGAVVLNQRRVGRNSVVGAAACVVHDVAESVTVKGVPAR